MPRTPGELAELEGRIEEAADAYEAAFENHPTIETALDLALLYWQSTDFGFARGRALDTAFIARAGTRFPELLSWAVRAFPGRTEAEFWRRYISWADLGAPLSIAECLDWMREDPTHEVPAMHVFAQTQGAQCEAGARWTLREYQPSRGGGDHDHCEYCGAKLSALPGDLQRGYVTSDDYHWICEPCFADFRDELGWAVD